MQSGRAAADCVQVSRGEGVILTSDAFMSVLGSRNLARVLDARQRHALANNGAVCLPLQRARILFGNDGEDHVAMLLRTPGVYMTREFARRLRDLSGSNENNNGNEESSSTTTAQTARFAMALYMWVVSLYMWVVSLYMWVLSL